MSWGAGRNMIRGSRARELPFSLLLRPLPGLRVSVSGNSVESLGMPSTARQVEKSFMHSPTCSHQFIDNFSPPLVKSRAMGERARALKANRKAAGPTHNHLSFPLQFACLPVSSSIWLAGIKCAKWRRRRRRQWFFEFFTKTRPPGVGLGPPPPPPLSHMNACR